MSNKRSLPEIPKTTSTEKVRRSKNNKSQNIENEAKENIRENVEMPSIKRITNKQRIKSPTSSSRRKLFKTETIESTIDMPISTQPGDHQVNNESFKNKKANDKPITNKSKKKKIRENTDISNNNEFGDTGIKTVSDKDTKVKRKRKSKTPKGFDASSLLRQSYDLKGLESQLTFDMDDDIVTAEPDKTDTSNCKQFSENNIRSETNAKLFIESADGFISAKKVDIERKRLKYENRRLARLEAAGDAANSPFDAHTSVTMRMAMDTNKRFLVFALFCHGLLAGIMTWQVVTITASRHDDYADLHRHYCDLSAPLHSVYLILFAICCISSFDRYDIHTSNKECMFTAISCESGGLSIPIYILGMIFHLTLSELDEKMSDCSSATWIDDESRDSDLRMWWILNLARSLCGLLGWAATVISPATNRIHTMLENILDEDILPVHADHRVKRGEERRGGIKGAFRNGLDCLDHRSG